MNLKKIYQKRLILWDTNEKSFDVWRCILWQRHLDTTVTSTEKGRWKIIETAAVWKHQVLDRLDLVESNFVYHMNKCAKRPSVRSSRFSWK